MKDVKECHPAWVSYAMAAAMPDCSEIEFAPGFLYEIWADLVGIEPNPDLLNVPFQDHIKTAKALAQKHSAY